MIYTVEVYPAVSIPWLAFVLVFPVNCRALRSSGVWFGSSSSDPAVFSLRDGLLYPRDLTWSALVGLPPAPAISPMFLDFLMLLKPTILCNSNHVLYQLMPPEKTTGSTPRERSHNYLTLHLIDSNMPRKNLLYILLFRDNHTLAR